MIAEYGVGLHGELLSVAHEICDHERVYGNGIDRHMQWREPNEGIGLYQAQLTTANEEFRVVNATFFFDDGDCRLGINRETSLDDDDWLGVECLDLFAAYLSKHQIEQHELCVAALLARREAAQAGTKLSWLRDPKAA